MAELKREFGKSENKSAKVAKLKKVETKLELQKNSCRILKKTARSKYEVWVLMEEFKKGMNGIIRRKLIEIERPPRSIEQ